MSINEGEGFLTPEILDELVKGRYTVNIQPLLESVSFNGLEYDENEYIPPFYVNFSDVLKEVSRSQR